MIFADDELWITDPKWKRVEEEEEETEQECTVLSPKISMQETRGNLGVWGFFL